ncbi:MAG: urease accessory protein UreD [Gammaproteobacteria bacterium]|nr:urease accessory protein UreD [Gammaproteobacteria bacterium]
MNLTLPTTLGWSAHLNLEFSQRQTQTYLSKREHRGPLVVQKPFYPGDGACHVYVLHPPGGIVGGDNLTLEVDAQRGTHVLLTTPSANKFYRSQAKPASLRQTLQVADGARLEWLPQETIVYDGAFVNMQTRINLAPQARFIGWEITCLGRPAAQEQFTRGECRQGLELWRDQTPLLMERARLSGGSPLLQAAWGMGGATVSATLLATPVQASQLEELRRSLCACLTGLFSMTLIDGVLIARFLGQQARAALEYFQTVWALLRPMMMGVQACTPRIWAT